MQTSWRLGMMLVLQMGPVVGGNRLPITISGL
jgi:hypothetical protein